MADYFSDFHQQAKQALELIRGDVVTLRTGKASVQMLDSVEIEAYGSRLKINELASVSAPDHNLLVVKPWDDSVIENIEKGIAASGLNLNPVVDGELIRIKIPPLTEERRQEMVKLLHQKIESGRVMLRSVRTNIKQQIEQQEGDVNVSEDDIHRDLSQLDKLTQQYIDQLNELAEAKEKELLTV